MIGPTELTSGLRATLKNIERSTNRVTSTLSANIATLARSPIRTTIAITTNYVKLTATPDLPREVVNADLVEVVRNDANRFAHLASHFLSRGTECALQHR
ncbi:MAG: hypothetical protein ABL984_16640 [Pyrinomonadaceae bacterium]